MPCLETTVALFFLIAGKRRKVHLCVWLALVGAARGARAVVGRGRMGRGQRTARRDTKSSAREGGGCDPARWRSHLHSWGHAVVGTGVLHPRACLVRTPRAGGGGDSPTATSRGRACADMHAGRWTDVPRSLGMEMSGMILQARDTVSGHPRGRTQQHVATLDQACCNTLQTKAKPCHHHPEILLLLPPPQSDG